MISRQGIEGTGSAKSTVAFEADAMALAIDGERSIAAVARSLGTVAQTVGGWVRQALVDRGERAGLTTDKRAELVRLPRENAQLAMERDLLTDQWPARHPQGLAMHLRGAARAWRAPTPRSGVGGEPHLAGKCCGGQ